MNSSGDRTVIAEVDRHIRQHVASVTTVFHELISDELHIDVHHVKPSLFRRFHVLVTSGMSAVPMETGEGAREFRFAELCIVLERPWRVSHAAFAEERWYWPIRLLKNLARYPFENRTWLGYGHTVSAPTAAAYAPDTELCGGILLPPRSLGEGFSRMQRSDGAETFFWAVVPLYPQELQFKLEHGASALMDALDAAGINDVVARDRPRVGLATPDDARRSSGETA
jgi:hypothetical protein